MALPSKGLVLHLSMREGAGTFAYDASRYGNDGALTGCKWVEKGLEFNGSSDYVNCGNNASLNIAGAMTVSAMFRQNSQAVFKTIASRWGSVSANRSWYLLSLLDTGESYIRFKVQDSSNIEYMAQNPSPISLNTWYHVVSVYDGFDIILYVNGIEADSVNAGTSLNLVTSPVIIGALGDLPLTATLFEMDGSISDVRIHNRALSAAEIKRAYKREVHNYK